MDARQSEAPPQEPRGTVRWLLWLSAGLLAATPLVWLDTRELMPGEGRFAQHALGALEGDRRGSSEEAAAGPDALLRFAATVWGTTERPLKLAVLGCLLVAAASVAACAVRLRGPAAAAAALLVFAASSLLARPDALRSNLTAALPLGLLLGLLPWLAGAPWPWLLPAAAGAALAPWFGPGAASSACAVACALLLVAACVPALRARATSAALVIASATVATLTFAVHALPWRVPALLHDPGGPALLDLLPGRATLPGWPAGAALVAWAAGSLFVSAGASSRRRMLPQLAVCLAAGAGVAVEPAANVLLLPALALLVGCTLRGWGFLALLLLVILAWTAREAPPPDVVRPVLAEARAAGRPGGRLVLSGPARFAALFYARRGHDPGMPLLLVPEDVRAETLATLLRDQLRIPRGTPHPAALPVLAWPPVTTAPGFESRPLPGTRLTRLSLRRAP